MKPLGSTDDLPERALAEIAVIRPAAALGMTPADLLALLPALWQAWAAHPAYPHWVEEFGTPTDMRRPVAVAVFRHEPGARGFTESYIVDTLSGLCASIAWGERNMGEFVEVCPVESHVPVNLYYQLTINHSWKSGRARGYACRKQLKALLPSRLRSCVSQARRFRRMRKIDLATHLGWVGPDDYDHDLHQYIGLPEAYHRLTKRDILVKHILPQTFPEIADYMAYSDFWDAVDGTLNPNDIADLVMHQPALFELEEAA